MKLRWKTIKVENFQDGVYIQKLVINPLFFHVSFQLKKGKVTQDAFILFSILTSALGTAIANLDQAPITLTGIELVDVFDSQQAITQKIVSKFKNEATKNLFNVLGSLDIVGNPVGLFQNISTGAYDLIDKPLKGFVEGPLQGGKGLVLGAGSFVKNTVAGTFNSVSKITGSLATGVSTLTLVFIHVCVLTC